MARATERSGGTLATPSSKPKSTTVCQTDNDYKVAWICALPLEMTAAKAMLDTIHDMPTGLHSLGQDSNVYVFGSIAKHNIVVACLPKGVYGTVSAANVLASIRRTFPTLRWGLMVGIGGGIPSVSNDIRLGDIVVGIRVMPYDLSKITGKGVVRISSSKEPDHTLLKAVTALESRHLEQPDSTSDRIATILTEQCALIPHFGQPGTADVLFKSSYDHQGKPSDACVVSCDIASHALRRPPRASSRPKIHYGTIASGNSVVKYSSVRDEMAQELDALSFEMEVAGLMHELPCLPIRGISDYSDTHKNKDWQKYAAANAAAYARELLEVLPPAPGGTRAPDDNDPGLEIARDQQRRDFMESLHFDLIDVRKKSIAPCQHNTCKWLLEQQEYRQWLSLECYSQHRGFLWIKGNPGCGKSTIMKFAYESEVKRASGQTERREVISAFFFNARGIDLEKSVEGMYRALLIQLLDGYPDIQHDVATGFPSGQKRVLSLPELEEAFRFAISQLGNRTLTCFIDALDEGGSEQVRAMVRKFERLVESPDLSAGQLRICFSSRHYPFIKTRTGIQLVLDKLPGHICDLVEYITRNLDIDDQSLKNQLSDQILRKGQGAFMWTVLVVKHLNDDAWDGIPPQDRLRRLEELPEDLNALFGLLLTQYNDNMQTFALAAVWILFAARPLTPREFYHAIWLKPQREDTQRQELPRFDYSDIDSLVRQRIISASKGLAEVAGVRDGRVQFIHESVRDYLLQSEVLLKHLESALLPEDDAAAARAKPRSPLELLKGYGHEIIKGCCMQYMSYTSAQPAPRGGMAGYQYHNAIAKDFPLQAYSTYSVLYHANAASGTIPQTKFLSQYISGTIKWSHFSFLDLIGLQPMGSLYHLASLGYAGLIRHWPERPSICMPCTGSFRYPILAAVASRHIDAADAVVALLGPQATEELRLQLQRRMKQSNTRETAIGRTPLSWACQEGIVDMVTICLDQGADIDEFDAMGRSPLTRSLIGNHTNLANLLLERDAKVQLTDHAEMAPLHACLEAGSSEASIWLVQHGADLTKFSSIPLESRGFLLAQPLHVAVTYNLRSSALAMLEAGAPLNVSTSGTRTDMPIHIAVRQQSSGLVQLLLDRGADGAAVNAQGRTPLHMNAYDGQVESAKLLLSSGVDFNKGDAKGHTPLHIAIWRQNLQFASLLLQRGADIGQVDNWDKTALHLASWKGHLGAVELLLNRGADAGKADIYGRTAFHIAALHGNLGLAKLLLRKAHVSSVKDKHGKTALCIAAEEGYWEIFRLLRQSVALGSAFGSHVENPGG